MSDWTTYCRYIWTGLRCAWLPHDFAFLTPTHNRVCTHCGYHDCRGPALGQGRIGQGHSG